MPVFITGKTLLIGKTCTELLETYALNYRKACTIGLEYSRPEGVAAGTLLLVGTNEETIYSAFSRLLTDTQTYEKMSHSSNPYGDGFASVRIADVLEASEKF